MMVAQTHSVVQIDLGTSLGSKSTNLPFADQTTRISAELGKNVNVRS